MQAPQAPQAPKGRIEGTVLKTGTNEPLVGVRVTLTRASQTGPSPSGPAGVIGVSISTSGNAPPLPPTAAPGRGAAPATLPTAPPPPPAIPSVVTDREGKFVIADLDAGSYRLLIVANGYVRQEYGQRVFPGQGTLLTLTAGQVMKDLVLHLTLTGNVSGRLRDNFGQPAVGVPVQLLKATYSVNGQKIFQSAGQSRTNDRGEYRLYWVTPGRYYLAAGSSPGPGGGGPFAVGGPPVSPNDPGDNYVFAYYPGVTDVTAASSIDVTSGNEASVDFLIPRQQLYVIRARAVDSATSQPPASITVSLSFSSITGGGGTFSMNTPYNPMTGIFEIRDVVPGSYLLQVSSQGVMARLPVDVTNNIDGLPVVLGGTVSLPGRLVIDGQLDQAGVERVRASLRPTNSAISGGTGFVTTNTDGTFRFENLMPGEYRISINAAQGSPDYFIKDAQFDRSDALNQPLVVSNSASGGASLEIVISPNVGLVEGVVTDEKLQPVAGVQAVLVPDKYRDRPELFKSATTDQTGHFSIKAVIPGDYKLFAWEVLESFGYFDADLLKQVEASGKPVHVGESNKLQVDVRVIPAVK